MHTVVAVSVKELDPADSPPRRYPSRCGTGLAGVRGLRQVRLLSSLWSTPAHLLAYWCVQKGSMPKGSGSCVAAAVAARHLCGRWPVVSVSPWAPSVFIWSQASYTTGLDASGSSRGGGSWHSIFLPMRSLSQCGEMLVIVYQFGGVLTACPLRVLPRPRFEGLPDFSTTVRAPLDRVRHLHPNVQYVRVRHAVSGRTPGPGRVVQWTRVVLKETTAH